MSRRRRRAAAKNSSATIGITNSAVSSSLLPTRFPPARNHSPAPSVPVPPRRCRNEPEPDPRRTPNPPRNSCRTRLRRIPAGPRAPHPCVDIRAAPPDPHPRTARAHLPRAGRPVRVPGRCLRHVGLRELRRCERGTRRGGGRENHLLTDSAILDFCSSPASLGAPLRAEAGSGGSCQGGPKRGTGGGVGPVPRSDKTGKNQLRHRK